MAHSTTDGMNGAPENANHDKAREADMSASGRAPLRVISREAARQIESRIILETLEQHRWNRRRTAEALKISYRSLMYKMKYCGLRQANPFSRPENK